MKTTTERFSVAGTGPAEISTHNLPIKTKERHRPTASFSSKAGNGANKYTSNTFNTENLIAAICFGSY
jgi:hypothetical protein